jgi:hypothetical protein
MHQAVTQSWFKPLSDKLIADVQYHAATRVVAAHLVKQLRIFLYSQHEKAAIANIEKLYATHAAYALEHIARIFFAPEQSAWLARLSPQVQYAAFKPVITSQYGKFVDNKTRYRQFEQLLGKSKPALAEISYTLLTEQLLRGKVNYIES